MDTRLLRAAGAALVCVLLSACGHHNGTVYLTTTTRDENGVVSSVRVERVGGEARFAAYRDGELLGLDGFDPDRLDWVDADRWVDHPDLDAWRRALQAAQRLAEDPSASPEAVAKAASAVPFRVARGDVLVGWAGDDVGRNAALLDALATMDDELPASRVDAIAEGALRADGLDDARLAAWVRYAFSADARDAARRIAAAPQAGRATARIVLDDIDEFLGSERKAAYIAVGKQLLGNADDERALAREIDELLASDRCTAMLALLDAPGATPAWHRALIDELDELLASDRAKVFDALAGRVQGDPESIDRLVGELDELLASHRRAAVLRLLRSSDGSGVLEQRLLREIDELLASDRAAVMDAIIAGRAFEVPAVQLAVVDATDELLLSDRKRMVRRIADDARTSPAAKDAAWEKR